jgi:hypothetical protein
MSKTYGFLLEFIPMKIGAGMTFLEVVLHNYNTKKQNLEIRKAFLMQEGLS